MKKLLPALIFAALVLAPALAAVTPVCRKS